VGPDGRHGRRQSFFRPNRVLAAAPFNALQATKRATAKGVTQFRGVAVVASEWRCGQSWVAETLSLSKLNATPLRLGSMIPRRQEAEFFALPGTTKLNPRFLAVWIKRFNRFSSIKVKAASSPPLA
jgi:hypothetical protein